MTTPQPDYVAWKFWLDILQLIGLIVIGVYTWWANSNKATNKRFARLEAEVRSRVTSDALDGLEKERQTNCGLHRNRTSSIEKELQGISGEIKHLPKQEDVARVHARMDSVSNEMNQVVGELKATRRQLDLVLEELLRRDKR